MDKGVGFNRNIRLEWLDATAAFCTEITDPKEIRARLEPIIEQVLTDKDNVRKAIDILLNIWFKSGEVVPALRAQAVVRYRETAVIGDRLWLHYGLTLITYPFFRSVAAEIGHIGRYEGLVRPAEVKKRVYAEMGEIGSINKAVERVLYSLRDWGLLMPTEQKNVYKPQYRTLSASNLGLESWLLSCALVAHPAQELPFADLVNLPELFPYRFTVSSADLRSAPGLDVQMQGLGFEMVRAV